MVGANAGEAVPACFVSGDDYTVTETEVPVRAVRHDDEQPVLRSQAKRLLARVEQFRTVRLEFIRIDAIGPAFADDFQGFRVTASGRRTDRDLRQRRCRADDCARQKQCARQRCLRVGSVRKTRPVGINHVSHLHAGLFSSPHCLAIITHADDLGQAHYCENRHNAPENGGSLDGKRKVPE